MFFIRLFLENTWGKNGHDFEIAVGRDNLRGLGDWGDCSIVFEVKFEVCTRDQSGISLNLRTGPTGHATLFNQ